MRPLRVGIDLTALLPLASGVDNYLKNLVVHLARIDDETRYTLFVNREDRNVFADTLPGNFAVVPASLRPRVARLLFQQAILPAAALGLGLDVVHSPAFLMPLVRGRQRHLLTVYDATVFSMPAVYHQRLHRTSVFRRAVASSIRRAHLVTVPSNATREALLGLFSDVAPERVRVVVPGIGDDFVPPRTPVSAAGRPYILFVGTIEPRKKVELLIDSYREVIAAGDIAEDLVLAGRLGWSYEPVLARLDAPELRGRVRLAGYVQHTELVRLYGDARLFVYPSLAEGFGFPPLEALACGVPAIVTDTTSLAENLRGAAELVPPNNRPALTSAIRRLLRDDAARAALRARGLERAARFRWEETARQTRECYEELGRVS